MAAAISRVISVSTARPPRFTVRSETAIAELRPPVSTRTILSTKCWFDRPVNPPRCVAKAYER